MLPIYSLTARVGPDGTVTVVVPDSYRGRMVSVSVTPQGGPGSGTGILDYLESLPAQSTAQEYWADREREFSAERGSWDR